MIEISPFIGRKFVLKPVSVWLCFPHRRKHNREERGHEGLVPRYGSWSEWLRSSHRGSQRVLPLLYVQTTAPCFRQQITCNGSPHAVTFTCWGCCSLCLWHKSTEFAHSFKKKKKKFCSCVCSCFYGPFNYISFHKFSRQLSAFSLCSAGLISAVFVLSTIYLLMNVSLNPDVILCGWVGLKHQLNWTPFVWDERRLTVVGTVFRGDIKAEDCAASKLM